MTPTTAKRMVNPRLGAYFAIFASAYVSLVLLALMADQMGAPAQLVRWTVLLVPLAAFAAIGIASGTSDPLEFFASGRRVPAVYNGTVMAISALGGTGLVAMTGTLFLVGFDALCIVIGGLAGFVVMGILLAPFFRKFGAYTVPSYLGRRFESPPLRLVSAVILAVPLLMMLAAEIKTAGLAAAHVTGASAVELSWLTGGALILALWPGGMRGLTWSSVAASIAALLTLVVPVAIVAVMWTNLPFPQFSYGPLMRTMARQEAGLGLPIVLAQGLAFDLPGLGLNGFAKRFASSFGVVGPGGFVAAMLTIMMSLAVAPWLLPRIATAPGVYHARKSLGWATVVFGLVMLTAGAVALFTRALLMDSLSNGAVPDWLRDLASRGLAEFDPKGGLTSEGGRSPLAGIGIARDVVLFALPAAAGIASLFSATAAAGVVAACVAGASASAQALAASLAEDIVHGMKPEPPPDGPRLSGARLALAASIGAGVLVATMVPGDPFDMVLFALALTGSSLFAVLVLSIWWKRINAFGAVAGLASGAAVALIAILAGHFDLLPFDPALAGMFGIPASLVAVLAASLATPYPGRHMLEMVRDIRVPGGEILYDREMRLLRLKKRQRQTTTVYTAPPAA